MKRRRWTGSGGRPPVNTTVEKDTVQWRTQQAMAKKAFAKWDLKVFGIAEPKQKGA